MALRISKAFKEIKCFKLLDKMIKKGYIRIESHNVANSTAYDKIVFTSSLNEDRRICEIHVDENDLVTFVYSENGDVTVDECETLNKALFLAKDFIWYVLPKQMLEDVLEIGSYNV